jgi:threonine/homoserine efflux transporter RhtA
MTSPERIGTTERPATGVVSLAFIGLPLAIAADFSRLDTVGLVHALMDAAACIVMIVALVRVNKQVGGLTTCFYMSCAGLALLSVQGASQTPLTWPVTPVG